MERRGSGGKEGWSGEDEDEERKRGLRYFKDELDLEGYRTVGLLIGPLAKIGLFP